MHVHIFVVTYRKNNRFQKKLFAQKTNIEYMNMSPSPPPPPPSTLIELATLLDRMLDIFVCVKFDRNTTPYESDSIVRISTVFQQGKYIGGVRHKASGRNQQVRCENVMLLYCAEI